MCGDGICNGTETCSTCPADCGVCPPVCGDGLCNGTETCSTCPADCGVCPPVCGDGLCNGGETCMTCPVDCGACCIAGTSSHCNGSPTPGCECMTPGCCGTACETTHHDGLGQNYYDCTALGSPGNPATYSVTLANEARAAWPVTGTDSTGSCGTGMNAATCVARASATECAVWCYTKALAGYVHLDTTSSACTCPGLTDPTWN